MTDEAELIQKRIAYLDTLRGLYRRERLIGFFVIMAGAALILPSRFYPQTWPQQAIWAGYALLAVGWATFIYVMWRRTAWRRANPFNPEA